MANILISFDESYDQVQYNSFIANLKTNKVEFKEFVSTRAPYYFYVEVDSKYTPVFLKYKVAPKGIYRYLLERVKPLQNNEQMLLTRRLSDSAINFEKFVSPNIFIDLKSADYAVVFRYRNKDQLIEMTKDLGIKVFVLGKHREWNLAFSFNKFIRSYVYNDWVLLEKNSPTLFKNPGEFEEELNYKHLIKVKLTNKTIDYPYYENGKYYPLKRIIT